MSRVSADDRLRSVVERIERLNEENDAINADKREIFAEARGNGYDVKALKAVIGIRKKRASDAAGHEEHEHMVALYLAALDKPTETEHARTPAPAGDPPDHQETPAPDFSSADGGLPQPSVPAEPRVSAASTSGSGPAEASSASAGAQPAEQTQSPSLSAPEEADCSNAGELIRPSGVSADETEGDGLAGGGDGAAAATSDDGLSIPKFLKRDANNRAPWMEGAG